MISRTKNTPLQSTRESAVKLQIRPAPLVIHIQAVVCFFLCFNPKRQRLGATSHYGNAVPHSCPPFCFLKEAFVLVCRPSVTMCFPWPPSHSSTNVPAFSLPPRFPRDLPPLWGRGHEITQFLEEAPSTRKPPSFMVMKVQMCNST